MLEKKSKIRETGDLCKKTKQTLKDYINVNAFTGFATGVAAGITVFTIRELEDTGNKVVVGGVLGALTAACAGMLMVSLKKKDDYIDNYSNTVKLNLVGRFIEAKGEEAKEDLIDTMLDEMQAEHD